MNTKTKMIITVWCLLAGAAGAPAAVMHYTYDDAGRLTGADYGGGATIAYVYDANGNLLQRTTTEGGVGTYTLIYRAGTGGRIDGVATQEVLSGASGSAVTAVVEDASAVFGRWNDGRMDQTRTDTNVQADLTVQAAFRSTGGADLDWYAARDIEPGLGEDWTHVDARLAAGKGTTLLHENIADTDPSNTNDVFCILRVDKGPPIVVHFQPGSTGRVYSFQFTGDLKDTNAWSNVPGTTPRPGEGGADSMTDTNDAPFRSHRIQVELP